MDKDIVPDLLKNIQQDFVFQTSQSEKLKKAFELLSAKKATYLDVNEFAVESGEILSKVLNTHITVDILPDGKMYYNIADRILKDTMTRNYEMISDFAMDVQTDLNHETGLRLRAQQAPLNQDRINGIVDRVSNEDDFEKIKWILDEPIVTFSQSIVDDTIKINATFHSKSGLKPTITRRVVGKACKWCRSLEGSYDYFEAPDDIYRRHERCRCTVDYSPDGSKRQNVWSKAWTDQKRNEKIEQRKKMNL